MSTVVSCKEEEPLLNEPLSEEELVPFQYETLRQLNQVDLEIVTDIVL